MDLAARIRQLREQRGMTQADVAIAIGVRTNRISELERNEGQASLPTLIALADLFNVTLDYLVGRRPPPSSQGN